MNVEAELEANRGRYYDFVTHMSKLTQGQSGANMIVGDSGRPNLPTS